MKDDRVFCDRIIEGRPCNNLMFRVPRHPINDVDVINPYWMCSECDSVKLVDYSITLSRDGEVVNFILLSKEQWNKILPLLAENFDLYALTEGEEVNAKKA